MGAILGIDAAWTLNGSSGVALIRQNTAGRWECIAVEAGYSAFISLIERTPAEDLIDQLPARRLIQVAEQLAKTPITLVVADIPLSRKPITGLRFADLEIGRRFGAFGCATHAPNSARPGPVSEHFRDGFEECGFRLATNASQLADCALIETYPHPALLSLMNANYRLEYKVNKTTKYWPKDDKPTRMTKLLGVLRSIHRELSRCISGIGFEVPETAGTFSELKPIEDKIDALVCAWVGIQVLAGKAEPFGDEEAAIWLPSRRT
ncbi:MAG: DUF429 domain-containing protein [Terracidiphilus sp.]